MSFGKACDVFGGPLIGGQTVREQMNEKFLGEDHTKAVQAEWNRRQQEVHNAVKRDYPPNGDALNVQVGGSHYKSMRIQPLEFCVANKLGPCESAIVKYISRWREKGGYEDLRKIKHYVDLLIELDQKYPLKIGE